MLAEGSFTKTPNALPSVSRQLANQRTCTVDAHAGTRGGESVILRCPRKALKIPAKNVCIKLLRAIGIVNRNLEVCWPVHAASLPLNGYAMTECEAMVARQLPNQAP